jgi:hypothetical protein
LSTRLLPRQEKIEDRAVSRPDNAFEISKPGLCTGEALQSFARRTPPEQSFAKFTLGVRKIGDFRHISGNLLFCCLGGLNMFANTMPRFYERVIPSVPLPVFVFQRHLQIIWLEAEHGLVV